MSSAGRKETDDAAARAALARLLSSTTFSRSAQLRRFIEHTVERTLEGRAADIKEYSIAVDVFGRRSSYDPRIDPIVRTEAQRLRKKLERYYETEGADDPIRIEYPKGSYVPIFVATPQARAPHRRLAALTAAFVLILIVGASVWWPSARKPEFASSEAPQSLPRVVVLPFDDFSPDAEHDDFALAMTDSVITRLARIPGLDVVSRGSVMHLIHRPASPSEAATLMNADYVVGGSVVRSGESCRVAAQLIRSSDERHVWSESFDFAWSDIFEAQDTVSAKLVEQLVATATPKHEPPTTTLEAYEAFLKGRYSAVQFNNNRYDRYFAEAERRLLHAVELDPGFADALAELGHVYYTRLYPPRGPRAETLERSRYYLERALEADPTQVTAVYTLGAVYAQTGRIAEGLELTRTAIRLDPKNAHAHAYLSDRYAELGFYESALAECDAAIELDPLFVNAYFYKAQHRARLGRWEEARETTSRLRDLFPGTPFPEISLGEVYYRQGELGEAERAWQSLYDALPEEDDRSYAEVALALLATYRGDVARGRAVFEKYRDSPRRYLDHFIELAAVLGETDTVAQRIEGRPYFMNYYWLVTNRSLGRLKGEPAFDELARTLHDRWVKHVAQFGDSLPVPPPALPDPEAFLSRTDPPQDSEP